MTDSKAKQWFELVSRVLVGSVLIYAGLMKALGPYAEFAAVIAAYQMLPAAFIKPLSVTLPWIEIWIGLFLVTGFHRKESAVVSAGMFAVFIAALGSAIFRKLDLNTCGCFGQDSLTPHQTLIGDIVLFGLSIALARLKLEKPLFSLERWLDR